MSAVRTVAIGLIAAISAVSPSLAAQQTTPAPSPAPAAPAVAPRPGDVESIDAILAALYASISGPAGQPRDFDRLRSLMAPNARFIPTGIRQTGGGVLRSWTLDEYIAAAGPGLTANGFFEREIGRTMERFGNIVHVMSAYDSKRTLQDAQPFQRGVNSIQLWYDGARWWVVNVFWQAETPAHPIPDRYLRAP